MLSSQLPRLPLPGKLDFGLERRPPYYDRPFFDAPNTSPGFFPGGRPNSSHEKLPPVSQLLTSGTLVASAPPPPPTNSHHPPPPSASPDARYTGPDARSLNRVLPPVDHRAPAPSPFPNRSYSPNNHPFDSPLTARLPPPPTMYHTSPPPTYYHGENVPLLDTIRRPDQGQNRSAPTWHPSSPATYDPVRAGPRMGEVPRADPQNATRPVVKLLGERVFPGEGLCYFYDDGSHVRKTIDGEMVNAQWGVTKAGKPRKRLAIACITCREKKIKCDPAEPKCVQCDKAGRECRFQTARATRRPTMP